MTGAWLFRASLQSVQKAVKLQSRQFIKLTGGTKYVSRRHDAEPISVSGATAGGSGTDQCPQIQPKNAPGQSRSECSPSHDAWRCASRLMGNQKSYFWIKSIAGILLV